MNKTYRYTILYLNKNMILYFLFLEINYYNKIEYYIEIVIIMQLNVM